jgi:DNA-binding response OmpR family regulator
MRVLLAEDEPSQQETLGIALTVTGYTVLSATNVDEAIDMLDADPEAAILDVRLPDPRGCNRDGLTVLHELRAKYPDIPVAMFTGVPLSEVEASFAQYHRAKVLYKPQTYDVVLDFLMKTSTPPAVSCSTPRVKNRKPTAR